MNRFYIKAAEKQIDKVVKQGFLLGETNEQIAKNLKVATNATLRDTRAIARTAVMDMSQRANERILGCQPQRDQVLGV